MSPDLEIFFIILHLRLCFFLITWDRRLQDSILKMSMFGFLDYFPSWWKLSLRPSGNGVWSFLIQSSSALYLACNLKPLKTSSSEAIFCNSCMFTYLKECPVVRKWSKRKFLKRQVLWILYECSWDNEDKDTEKWSYCGKMLHSRWRILFFKFVNISNTINTKSLFVFLVQFSTKLM